MGVWYGLWARSFNKAKRQPQERIHRLIYHLEDTIYTAVTATVQLLAIYSSQVMLVKATEQYMVDWNLIECLFDWMY